jgi:translation machinery-associated protein 16
MDMGMDMAPPILQPPNPLPASLLPALIKVYTTRHDEELSALQSARRPGRPATSREDTLRAKAADEASELVSGFWMPDLTHAATCQRLAEWDGKWNSLAGLKFVRVEAGNGDGDGDGVILRESRFPPKAGA